MPELNVAVLGCGRMGRERARCVRALGARVSAFFDPDKERGTALAQEYGAIAVASQEELPWSRLDAVFFCTPPNCREQQAMAALREGVPFFAEKPVGLSKGAAGEVEAALLQRPVLNAVGYMNRCRASILYARSALASCRLLGLAGFWVCKKYNVPWWLDDSASGGPLNEQATHLFDLCRFLAGEIDSVDAIAAQGSNVSAQALGSASTIRFASGSTGTLFYSCEARDKDIGLHLFTDCGSLYLEGWDFHLAASTIEGTKPLPAETEDIFLKETAQFLQAVQSGRQEEIPCSWRDAMRTQAAVDAARQSMSEHTMVSTRAQDHHARAHGV